MSRRFRPGGSRSIPKRSSKIVTDVVHTDSGALRSSHRATVGSGWSVISAEITFVSRMITWLVPRIPLLAAEIDRACPDLAAQLRERVFQAEAAETVGNPRPKPFGRAAAYSL